MLERLALDLEMPIGAEDLFAYAYALLSAPAYVERFWDELTRPGPRLPLTRSSDLFRRAVDLGRRLIHLHTFGERFASSASRSPAAGLARCTRSPGTMPESYPERFEHDAGRSTLRVGQGEFAPVTRDVWEFSVSGFEVVPAWLGDRMREPAGRKSSPLDEIRPERWTAALTEELLELLWALEGTVALAPELGRLLDEVAAGPLFAAQDLPQPAAAERRPPLSDDDDNADDDAQQRLPNE
jgi:hypothetical protein